MKKKASRTGLVVNLPEVQWQVVMRALMTVNAPMAETAPVYNELIRQLNAEKAAQAPAGPGV